jgi:hypothetical protein
MLPTIDPEMARLARVAIKNEIPLRPDMLSDSKLGKAVGGFLEHDIPLAGSKEPSRTAAYNKALVRQIGGDTTKGKLTSQVYNDAMTYNGKKIGEIAGQTAIPDPAPLLEKASVIVDDARGYGADTYRLVRSKAETLRGLVKDGVVNGEEFQKWNSKMLRDMRATNDGIKKQVLGELQDVAMDTFEAYIDPKKLPEWKTVRKQYAIGRQIQPSVAESLTGDLSPSSVMRDMLRGEDAKHRVAYGFGGEASDIAKVGKLFVEEPGLKTSIPERYVAYRGLGALGLGGSVGYAAGSGGALPAAAGAAGLYSLANLYNRLGPAAARALAKDRSAGLFPLIEGP